MTMKPGFGAPNYQFRGLLNFANDACCFAEGVAVNPLTGGIAQLAALLSATELMLYLSRMIGNSGQT